MTTDCCGTGQIIEQQQTRRRYAGMLGELSGEVADGVIE